MINLEIKNTDCHAALAMTKNAQSGRSMIEMLGVLAIIGVLSVGGIAGYSKAMMKYRINKTIEQITLIAGNVRAFWGPQKNYIGVECYSSGSNGTCPPSGCMGVSGVNAQGDPTTANNGCPIVKKAKIFPDDMITVTDGKIMSITNPFGGVVELRTSDKAKSGDNQAFYIYYNINNGGEEACIELLAHDWTAAGVKGIRLRNGPPPLPSATVPVSMDIAIAMCSNQYGNNAFEFYVDVSDNCWNDTSGYICS